MKRTDELLKFILRFQYGCEDVYIHSYKDIALLKVITYASFEMLGEVKHLTIIDRESPLNNLFDINGSDLRGRDSALVWTPKDIIVFNVRKVADEIITYKNKNGLDMDIPVHIIEPLLTRIKFNEMDEEL